MELLKTSDGDQEVEQKPVSVLQGDGICMNRILARESSVGKSSHIFYRSGEGVPFIWEMQPGTPKNPQEDEVIPPICPSPLMQSIGLPLPNLDHDEPHVEPASKTSKMWRLREMVKKRINGDIIKKVDILGRRSKQQESSRFSSICPSSPFSSSRRVVDVSMVDGPFCCSPWNIPAILDEGNTRIFYCSQHKNAYAGEEDDLFPSRILSGVSSAEHFSGEISPPAGVPFGWEMQPGTPKVSPEDELIPPPSPPPAVQSLSLPRRDGGRDKAKKPSWKKAWFWMRRRNGKKKETKKIQKEISFRYNGKMDDNFEASLRRSVSVSSSISPLSKGGWRVSRIKRNLQGRLMSCGPWSRRDILVFAGNKWNLFKS